MSVDQTISEAVEWLYWELSEMAFPLSLFDDPASIHCIDRYLKVTNWARRRYTRDGSLILTIGGVAQEYYRIEQRAFGRYFS